MTGGTGGSRRVRAFCPQPQAPAGTQTKRGGPKSPFCMNGNSVWLKLNEISVAFSPEDKYRNDRWSLVPLQTQPPS